MAEDARAVDGKLVTPLDNGETPVIVLTEAERRSIAINGIFLLLALAAIYFASSFLIPVTIALLLSMLFSPVVRACARVGIPAPVTAAATVAFTLIVILAGIYGLSGSANEWVEKVPAIDESSDGEDKGCNRSRGSGNGHGSAPAHGGSHRASRRS